MPPPFSPFKNGGIKMVGYGLNSYQRRYLRKIYDLKGWIRLGRDYGDALIDAEEKFIGVLTQRQRRLYERNNSENKVGKVFA